MSESDTDIDVRGHRKQRTGIVISDIQDKTIVVNVDRLARHPRYKKVITISKKYYAHDEDNKASKGDKVIIQECRPLSKLKRWRLSQVEEKTEG